jgi:hypothetical protein
VDLKDDLRKVANGLLWKNLDHIVFIRSCIFKRGLMVYQVDSKDDRLTRLDGPLGGIGKMILKMACCLLTSKDNLLKVVDGL